MFRNVFIRCLSFLAVMIPPAYQWAQRRITEGGKESAEYYVQLHHQKVRQLTKILTEKRLTSSYLLELGLIREVTDEGRGQGLDEITTFYHHCGRIGEPATEKERKEIAEFNKIPENEVDSFCAKVDTSKRTWVAQSFNIPESEVDSLVAKVREILGEEYIQLNKEIYS